MYSHSKGSYLKLLHHDSHDVVDSEESLENGVLVALTDPLHLENLLDRTELVNDLLEPQLKH